MITLKDFKEWILTGPGDIETRVRDCESAIRRAKIITRPSLYHGDIDIKKEHVLDAIKKTILIYSTNDTYSKKEKSRLTSLYNWYVKQ